MFMNVTAVIQISMMNAGLPENAVGYLNGGEGFNESLKDTFSPFSHFHEMEE